MGDSRPDVFKASALQHPLYHVATVRAVVDRLGIDIPKQLPRKALDKFTHRKNFILNAAPTMGETSKVYQKLSTPRTVFSPHFMAPPKDSVQSKEPFPGSHYFDCNAVFRNRVAVVVGYQQQVIATCLLRDIATNAIVS